MSTWRCTLHHNTFRRKLKSKLSKLDLISIAAGKRCSWKIQKKTMARGLISHFYIWDKERCVVLPFFFIFEQTHCSQIFSFSATILWHQVALSFIFFSWNRNMGLDIALIQANQQIPEKTTHFISSLWHCTYPISRGAFYLFWLPDRFRCMSMKILIRRLLFFQHIFMVITFDHGWFNT